MHALQNLIWGARRAKKKILLISLDWRNFFGSIGQDAFLAVAGMVEFSSEDFALYVHSIRTHRCSLELMAVTPRKST